MKTLSSKEITYITKQSGSTVEITAHLPAGFVMTTYTRVFQLSDAGSTQEALGEFLSNQRLEMFQDLVRRIAPAQLAAVSRQQIQSGKL